LIGLAGTRGQSLLRRCVAMPVDALSVSAANAMVPGE